MRRARKPLVAMLLAASLGVAARPLVPVARAQARASAPGSATATVVAPLAVVREADLDFGTVTTSPVSGGTVTLVPMGGALYAGGVDAICATACAPPHPALFAVHGEAGRAYLVTLPASLSIALPGSGGASVVVDSLVAATTSSPRPGRGILSAEGQDRFAVGGTLHLPASAPAAQYTTQVPVVVAYM